MLPNASDDSTIDFLMQITMHVVQRLVAGELVCLQVLTYRTGLRILGGQPIRKSIVIHDCCSSKVVARRAGGVHRLHCVSFD